MAAVSLNENFSTNIENLKKDIVRLEMGLNKAKSDLEVCLNSTKSEIMSEIVKLIDNLQSFHSKMKQFDAKFDFIERKQVSATIVISGIPLIANDSVENIFSKISNAINFERGIEAVDCIFRMKSPKLLLSDVISKKPIPICVRFISERLKVMFFKNYLALKSLSLSHIGLEMNTRIYCNQYLTKHNYSILQAAFKAKQTGNTISNVFTKGGLVFMLFNNNRKPAVLRSIDDLHNAIKQYNSAINLNTVTSIDENRAVILNKNQPIQEKSSLTSANTDAISSIATINMGQDKPVSSSSSRITRNRK